MRTANLLALPVELICHVLSYLDTRDLIRAATVTKYLRKVVLDSSRFQYAIELAKYRMVSLLPPSVAPPFASRLSLLREKERAWRNMDWKGRHKLKLPPTGSVYEFSGGLYGNGREDEERVTASISFLELPSADEGVFGKDATNLKTWTHTLGDIRIIDFTMDPSQDLLVLVAVTPLGLSDSVYELHLRSLSTNQPHPRAALPVLPCLDRSSTLLEPVDAITAVRVQVSGDLVALLIKEVPDNVGAHLEIWNWTSGPEYSCKMTRVAGIDDFSFLSDDCFLLVRPTGRFEVYTFADPITGCTVPIPTANYAFPPLTDGYIYWYISMSNNPSLGHIPKYGNVDPDGLGRQRRGDQIYHPSLDERIHACCVYIFNPTADGDQGVHSFVFFFNVKTLLNPPAEWATRPHQIHPTLFSRSASRSSVASSSSSDSETNLSLSSNSSLTSTTPSSVDLFTNSSTSNAAIGPFPLSQFDLHSLMFASEEEPENCTSSSHLYTLPSRSRHAYPASAMPSPIPWDTWGPQNTRWFQERLSTDWQHAIYGLRTVETVRTKMDNTTQLEIEELDPSSLENAAAQLIQGHTILSDDNDDDDENGEDGSPGPPFRKRHIRIRDFNPYAVACALDADLAGDSVGKGKGKAKWCSPRVITGPSTTPVRGVFKHDIVSWLPYTEVVSEETFEITDVMMDDSRLMLLKRGKGQAAKLKSVVVLTM